MAGLLRSLTHPVADAWRRPACLVLAVLAAVFVLASAAEARTDLAGRTRALHTMIGAQAATAPLITGTSDFDDFVAGSGGRPGSPTAGLPAGGPQFAQALALETPDVYAALETSTQPAPLQPQSAAWASLISPFYKVGNAAATAVPPHGTVPVFQLYYLQNEASHARLVAGHWPKGATETKGLYYVEAALPTTTLKQLGLRVGTTLLANTDLNTSTAPPPPIHILITGSYEPIDPSSVYWQTQPADAGPQLFSGKGSEPYYIEGGLLGPNELNDLALVSPFGFDAMNVVWNVPLNISTLSAENSGTLSDELAVTLPQAALTLQNESYAVRQLLFLCPVAGVLAQFQAEQFASQLETAMLAVSLALLGLLALLFAARSSVDRTEGENSVLRARGAPLWRLAGIAAVRAAVTVLPLTAAGFAIAALIPGQSPTGLWRDELLVPLAAVAAPIIITILRYRHTADAARAGSGASGSSGSSGMSRPQTRSQARARRIVLQAALVVLCLFGLDEARSQGFSPGGGINLFTAAAPVLAAALAALVVLNLGPLLIRLLLHTTGRRRGAIGLLGLARTARAPGTAAATVFILTLVLATADLAVTLHHTTGQEGAAAAAAQAVYRVANLTGSSLFVSPATYGPDALEGSTASHLALLAALAVAAGCLAVALTALGDADERRSTTARLSTMGLTAAQARAITAVELFGPIVLAAVGGTAAAGPLLWTVRPALTQALGGANARLTADSLALAPLCVAALALAAGLAAAAAARRGPTRALRLGDPTRGA